MHITNLKIRNFRAIENLELNFNIFNVNNNSYITVSKEVEFIKPSLTINKINSHAGDTVNISATINNYSKESIDSVEYKFQYKKISDISFEYYNNTLTILNYKLADYLMSKDYNIEIICYDELLTEPFLNKSKISISKYDTHSLIYSNVSNNLLNISAKIFDSNDNPVNGGTVIVKINGISVKSLKVTNGNISIVNYKIDKKYQKEDYTLLLVYSGNNQYYNHKNSSTVNIIKENTLLSLSCEIKGNTLNFIYDIKGNTNNLKPDEGFIVFKINGKSLSGKMDLSKDEIVLSYDISNILNIRNITLSFYGSKLYDKNSLTVNVTDERILII